jgi:hypothetical protein
MRKTITLIGKAAEQYFYSRCALNIALCEEGMYGVYPVLVTEYKLNGNGQNCGAETELIMVNVAGDLM